MTSVALLGTPGGVQQPTDTSSIESKLEKLNLKLLQNKLFQSNRTYYLRMSPLVSSYSSNRYMSSGETALRSDETLTEKRPASELCEPKKVKKAVRFADALGFELVTICCVSHTQPVKLRRLTSDEDSEDSSGSLDDEDTPSSNDEEDLMVDNAISWINQCSSSSLDATKSEMATNENAMLSATDTFICDNLVFTWHCLFEQPGISPDFYARLNVNKVLLESIYSTNMRLNGIVRVLNLAYVKRVFIRYTINNWHTYTDLDCDHFVSNGSEQDKLTDRFVFSVCLDKAQVFSCIDDMNKMNRLPQLKFEFAVCYLAGDSQTPFWDNNRGLNYQYDCTFRIGL